MKIAVCLHGKFSGKNLRNQTQSFDLAYDYFKKNFLNNYNIDTYLHGWDDNPEDTKRLLKKFKPLKFKIEKQKKFKTPKLKYKMKKTGPWSAKKKFFNYYSRLYSLKECFKLVKKKYDYILVMRYDCIFYKKIKFDLLKKNTFYVSNWSRLNKGYGFTDGWFLSDQKIMRKIAYTYDRLNFYYKNNSKYINFILSGPELNEDSISSFHPILKFRIKELNLEKNINTLGYQFLTWGLVRDKFNKFNPAGVPDIDVNIPCKNFKKIKFKRIILNKILNVIYIKPVHFIKEKKYSKFFNF